MTPQAFEGFWAGTLAELDRIDPALTVERSELRSTERVDTFEVTYTSLDGVAVFGWLCAPVGGRSRPGVVLYPGYGGNPSVPRSWAEIGYVALQISPRGHHRSDGMVAPGFPGLMTDGIDDPSSYIYRGIYCDAHRAVDVLLGRPEVDRARVAVHGTSQGGALALVAAALRSEVVAAAADVPFLTSIREALELGHSYPYQEIVDHLRLHPGREARVLEVLDHIDTVHLAPRIRARLLLSVGLRDDVCPPATIRSLIARLGCEHELVEYPDGGHEGGGAVHMARKLEWLGRQLAL
jgi:cephalosporin-C deacetylase